MHRPRSSDVFLYTVTRNPPGAAAVAIHLITSSTATRHVSTVGDAPTIGSITKSDRHVDERVAPVFPSTKTACQIPSQGSSTCPNATVCTKSTVIREKAALRLIASPCPLVSRIVDGIRRVT